MWEDMIAVTPGNERVVGENVGEYEDVHRQWGFRQRNKEGERFLEAARSVELFLANTGFKKHE